MAAHLDENIAAEHERAEIEFKLLRLVMGLEPSALGAA
jgi:hypothetical protein